MTSSTLAAQSMDVTTSALKNWLAATLEVIMTLEEWEGHSARVCVLLDHNSTTSVLLMASYLYCESVYIRQYDDGLIGLHYNKK